MIFLLVSSLVFFFFLFGCAANYCAAVRGLSILKRHPINYHIIRRRKFTHSIEKLSMGEDLKLEAQKGKKILSSFKSSQLKNKMCIFSKIVIKNVERKISEAIARVSLLFRCRDFKSVSRRDILGSGYLITLQQEGLVSC
jgi:hypothetical protein